MTRHILGLVATGLVAGCAGAPAPAANEEGPASEAVLLLATDRYELHLRDGRVFHLEDGQKREVTDYDQMRELYQREGTDRLPEDAAQGGTEVMGWRDQECVREGRACGTEPAIPARDMVRIRFQFR